MQDHVWVIQQLIDGEWIYFETRTARSLARSRARWLRMRTRTATRIRKFIAA